MVMLLKFEKHRKRLPYDGIIRTGSKGVSHCANLSWTQTPSEVRKVLERQSKSKALNFHWRLFAVESIRARQFLLASNQKPDSGTTYKSLYDFHACTLK